MHIYSSILVASLLVLGLAVDRRYVGVRSERLQQANWVRRQLLAQDSSNSSDCSDSSKSPLPGCGRRDT